MKFETVSSRNDRENIHSRFGLTDHFKIPLILFIDVCAAREWESWVRFIRQTKWIFNAHNFIVKKN